MKIKSIGSNKTEVHLEDPKIDKYLILLISYETPVALIRHNSYTVKHGLRTDEFHSVTTSKHINQWFKENGIDEKYIATMSQDWFNSFLDDNH